MKTVKAMRFFDDVTVIIESYGKSVVSSWTEKVAWYHNAPAYKEPRMIRDANPLGVSWPDYLGFQLPCPECGGEMVDVGYSTDDATHLRCACGHEYERSNDTYHSDHPDAKWGGMTSHSESDPIATLSEIVERIWLPKIPKKRKDLWDLQRHLAVFGKAAKAYNSYIKSICKEIYVLKNKKNRAEAEQTKLGGMLCYIKEKRFVNSQRIFNTYCGVVGADPEVVDWVTSNWEALMIKDVYKKPSIEGRMPMSRKEGKWEEREFTQDDLLALHDYRRYSDEDLYLMGYVAKMLIRSPRKCLEKIYETNARRSIKENLLDLVDIVDELKIVHPSTKRWKTAQKWSRMTAKQFWREVEEEEILAQYDAEIF